MFACIWLHKMDCYRGIEGQILFHKVTKELIFITAFAIVFILLLSALLSSSFNSLFWFHGSEICCFSSVCRLCSGDKLWLLIQSELQHDTVHILHYFLTKKLNSFLNIAGARWIKCWVDIEQKYIFKFTWDIDTDIFNGSNYTVLYLLWVWKCPVISSNKTFILICVSQTSKDEMLSLAISIILNYLYIVS